MKHSVELLVASMELNNFMTALDLRMGNKYFCFPLSVDFVTPTPVDDAYLMRIIEKSFEAEASDIRIPGLIYHDVLYSHPTVKCLSWYGREVFL